MAPDKLRSRYISAAQTDVGTLGPLLLLPVDSVRLVHVETALVVHGVTTPDHRAPPRRPGRGP